MTRYLHTCYAKKRKDKHLLHLIIKFRTINIVCSDSFEHIHPAIMLPLQEEIESLICYSTCLEFPEEPKKSKAKGMV